MVFFSENWAQIATSRGERNLKPPYVDIGSKTMISTHFVRGIPNLLFSLFHLLPKFSQQALLRRITKLTASQISNTEPLHSA